MQNIEQIIKEYNLRVEKALENDENNSIEILDSYAKKAGVSYLTFVMLALALNEREKTNLEIVDSIEPALELLNKEIAEKKVLYDKLNHELSSLSSLKMKLASKSCEIKGHNFTPWQLDDLVEDGIYWYHRVCKECGYLEQDYSYDLPKILIKK